jgi:hypothetical protein
LNKLKAFDLLKTNIVIFLVLLAIVTLAPYARNQFITGTIVNCALLIVVATLGIRAGSLMCIIPSLIALAIGLLPMPLAPMVPFIILGNVIFVIVFDYLHRINYWLGAISGAVLKFAFLMGMMSIVTHLVNNSIAANVAYMMSWPQLVTALMGCVAAFVALRLKSKLVF